MLVRGICCTYDVCGRNHLEVSAWRRCREMIGATVQPQARESDEEEWRGREEGDRSLPPAEAEAALGYLVEAQACVMPDMHVPVSATASSLHTRSMRGSGLQCFGPACFAILRTLHVRRLPDKYLPRHHNTSASLRSRAGKRDPDERFAAHVAGCD
jgi:hypothetical protein